MLLNPLMDARQLLEWHIEAGVDEACDDAPVNYFTAVPPPALREAAPVAAPIAASVADAVASVLADMPPQTAPAQPRPLTPALFAAA